MRAKFHQYFKPLESEIKTLWANGLFSFDASVLLNVYGYSDETCEDLVAFLEKNAERIRLPHQFALEFSRNRASVIIKQIDNHIAAEKDLKKILNVHFEPKRDHPYLSDEALSAFHGITQELSESREEMEGLLSYDPFCDRMLSVFNGRTGAEPTSEECAQFHKEAQQRYAALVPPGYCDLKQKPIPDAYGDCVAWMQLIQIAKTEKKDLVLAIDDLKEDWWQIEHERTVGPRPELLKEFFELSGQRLYLYNSFSFLRAAKQYGAADILDRVIREIEIRLESQRQEKFAAGMKALAPSESNGLKIDLLPGDEKVGEPLKSAALVPADVESLKPDTQGEEEK